MTTFFKDKFVTIVLILVELIAQPLTIAESRHTGYVYPDEPKYTCADWMRQSTTTQLQDDIYEITDEATGDTLNVWCQFQYHSTNEESIAYGYAWTLIQSGTKTEYKSTGSLHAKDFYEDLLH